MKKYILLFSSFSFFGILSGFSQSMPSTKQNDAAVVTDTARASGNTAHGTISRAGKNQQSVYTPPASGANNTPATAPSSQQALPAKTEQAVIDPKKK